MSDEAMKDAQATINEFLRKATEASEREAARRAALTSGERAAEDQAAADKSAADSLSALEKKFRKAADPYRGMPSLTLAEFAYLLLGEKPGSDEWSIIKAPGVAELQEKLRRYTRTTAAPVAGVPLYPVNPSDAADKFRYPRAALFDVALAGNLGRPDVLARAMGYKAGAPTLAPASAQAVAVTVPTAPPAPVAAPATVTPRPADDLVSVSIGGLVDEVVAACARRDGKRGWATGDALKEYRRRSNMKALYGYWVDRVNGSGDVMLAGGVTLEAFRDRVRAANSELRFHPGNIAGDAARKFLEALLQE